MRRITKKSPAILMLAINVAIAARNTSSPELEEICSKAPTTMIPLIELVTLISGVCNAGDTLQMTR